MHSKVLTNVLVCFPNSFDDLLPFWFAKIPSLSSFNKGFKVLLNKDSSNVLLGSVR